MNTGRPFPRLDATDPARRAARRLVAEASSGTLACLSSATGAPLVSRVAVSTDSTGDPTILVSRLARHTGAMAADPRVALLIGEPGSGDALAHARLSLEGTAVTITPGEPEHARIRRRFLARRPESKLYIDFADFTLMRIALTQASFNGGFARAYDLDRNDLCIDVPHGLADGEAELVDHLNAHHEAEVQAIAATGEPLEPSNWRIVTLDPRGFEMAAVGTDGRAAIRRIEFGRIVENRSDYLTAFATLTQCR